MRIKNSRQLDQRLQELTSKRDKLRASLFETSDSTRETASTVQTALYAGQVALSVFRIVTNFRLSRRKKIWQVAMAIGGLFFTQWLRKRLGKRA